MSLFVPFFLLFVVVAAVGSCIVVGGTGLLIIYFIASNFSFATTKTFSIFEETFSISLKIFIHSSSGTKRGEFLTPITPIAFIPNFAMVFA